MKIILIFLLTALAQAQQLDSSFDGHYSLQGNSTIGNNCKNFRQGLDVHVAADLSSVNIFTNSEDFNFAKINQGKQEDGKGNWTDVTLKGLVLTESDHGCVDQQPDQCVDGVNEVDFGQKNLTFKMSMLGTTISCFLGKN